MSQRQTAIINFELEIFRRIKFWLVRNRMDGPSKFLINCTIATVHGDGLSGRYLQPVTAAAERHVN